jgi:ubiquinone/menaquinone biosynthesis C-methylase UbiE
MIERANFGIDAPGVIRNLLLVALAALCLGLASEFVPALQRIKGAGWGVAIICTAQAALMLWTSLRGKRIVAATLVDRADLRGEEQVLDVGCGRGLLLIEAARRLSGVGGKAAGLDLWNAEDLSGNNRAATLANAAAFGVSDRIELVDGDMCAMPFEDGRFDVVVSSMAIHNVYAPERRAVALREIARVLKPGGRALLQDFRHTADYARQLEALGFTGVQRQLVNPLLMFPFTWCLQASKPPADPGATA